MNWDLNSRLKSSRPSDPALDFCLWPYEPPRLPSKGALRSSALLFQSFAVAGVSEHMLAICDAIKDRFGLFKTVWGIKYAGEQLSWEFYFYDYLRADRRLGVGDFMDATKNQLRYSFVPDDSNPYFMFSVEIDDRHAQGEIPIDQIDIYIGNPGSEVSSGICYGLSAKGYEMRNFYFFFDAIQHQNDIRNKVLESTRLPYGKVKIDNIIWPEMNGVQTIVVANKRYIDGMYFSRITIDQLILFLEKLKYPVELREFMIEQHEALGHHLFDVGYDFLPDKDSDVRYLKGSYYGIL